MAEYEKYLKELPDIVRQIIAEENVQEKLHNLAKEYKIHFDKWIALENEIMLTLIGKKDPDMLVRNISNISSIDLIEAQALAEDIGEKIFKPINEKLQDVIQGGRKRAIQTLKNSINSQEVEDISYNENVSSSNRDYSSDDPYREPI